MKIKERIRSLALTHYPEIIKIRRILHANPELSFEEYETSALICKILDEWGVEYKGGYAGTGIVAVLNGSGKGRVIGLRADMDALPVNEENNLPFKSKNQGKMHACGHDVHSAVLLGAIRILMEIRDQWSGRIKFVFQPGEEKLPGGAKLMLKENALGPDEPEIMIAHHVSPELETGRIGFCPGRYMASSDEIYINVTGKGGHGALPDELIDPVLISAYLITSLQQIVSRNTKPGIPTVLSFGKVFANGAANVIPDHVIIEGTFRTMNEEWRNKAHEMIKDICKNVVKGMGGNVEIEIKKGYPALVNNPEITEKAISAAKEFLGDENVLNLEPRMTAEDFAYFAERYPSVLFRLGTGSPNNTTSMLHTSGFMVDENSLLTGMELCAWLSLSFLKN